MTKLGAVDCVGWSTYWIGAGRVDGAQGRLGPSESADDDRTKRSQKNLSPSCPSMPSLFSTATPSVPTATPTAGTTSPLDSSHAATVQLNNPTVRFDTSTPHKRVYSASPSFNTDASTAHHPASTAHHPADQHRRTGDDVPKRVLGSLGAWRPPGFLRFQDSRGRFRDL